MARHGRRSVRFLALAGLAAGGLVAASAARADGWITFSPPGGGFSIEMPAPPTSTVMESNSPIGDVADHVFTAVGESERFVVDYSKLPRFALDFVGADTIYDHAKGALLKQTYGKPISFGDVSTAGQSGKKLVYQLPPVPGKPPMTGEAHFFLVGGRIYVVDAIVPAGGSEPRAQRFLGSLQFQ